MQIMFACMMLARSSFDLISFPQSWNKNYSTLGQIKVFEPSATVFLKFTFGTPCIDIFSAFNNFNHTWSLRTWFIFSKLLIIKMGVTVAGYKPASSTPGFTQRWCLLSQEFEKLNLKLFALQSRLKEQQMMSPAACYHCCKWFNGNVPAHFHTRFTTISYLQGLLLLIAHWLLTILYNEKPWV